MFISIDREINIKLPTIFFGVETNGHDGSAMSLFIIVDWLQSVQ
jgi:hypothetical protein